MQWRVHQTLLMMGMMAYVVLWGWHVSAQEAIPWSFWTKAENACYGDLACMLRTLDEAPPAVPHRGWTNPAELSEALKKAGRFRQLGLTESEGERLVQEVFQRLHHRFGGRSPQKSSRPPEEQALPAPLPAPDFPYRASAEFEPVRAVLLRWPFDWAAMEDAWARMIEVFARSGVTAAVWVNTPFQREKAMAFLMTKGVPTEHLRWVVEPTDTIWIRDYGPPVVRAPDSASWAVVDFHYYNSRRLDDNTPRVVAWGAQVPLVDRQRDQVVHTEGGNLNHDGWGLVVYSDRTYKRNPGVPPATVDARLQSAFQAVKGLVPKAPVLDGTGHVDMFMKIVAPDTVLVGRYNPQQVDYQVLEDCAAMFSRETNGRGEPWRVVRIVQPDVTYAQFVVPVVRTYTNSLIVNDFVIIPVYGLPEDEEALRVYQEVFPDKTLVPLQAEDIIPSGGAWHCVTLELALPENG